MNRSAVLYALISAALFGVSTPAAKVLVGAIDPVVLAGLLYCIGVAVLRRVLPQIVSGAPDGEPAKIGFTAARDPFATLQSGLVALRVCLPPRRHLPKFFPNSVVPLSSAQSRSPSVGNLW